MPKSDIQLGGVLLSLRVLKYRVTQTFSLSVVGMGTGNFSVALCNCDGN